MKLSVLTMIKNEAKRLPEWLYFHKTVHDVDIFLFYLDNPDDNSKDVLDSLKKEYNIEYFYTRSVRRKRNEFAGGRQTDSFTRGSIYLKNICDWIAIFDVDEFIVPNGSKNLKEVLPNLIEKRLYIGRWYFKPPFDINKSITQHCFYRWSDEERIIAKHTGSGKSVFKTSEYNNTSVNTHYGPYPDGFIPDIQTEDFKIHHFQSKLDHINRKYEVFDDSILKFFSNYKKI